MALRARDARKIYVKEEIMERKLGIDASCLPGVAEIDALDKIKAAGFDMVFGVTNDAKTVCDMKDKCEKLGLSFDFLHAPFRGINDFWRSGLAYRDLRDNIKASIDSAAAAGVPAVVVHVSSGWFPPPICDIGFARFDDLVEHAIDKGVKIAFENLRKLGNLAVIMERYKKIPNVGFCYDCGHEHCYTETVHFLDIYGSRTLCTHIHDNLGRDKEDKWKDADLHLMPFDGDIDYADMMARLNKVGYTGALTLEITKYGEYLEKSDEEFLAVAYERIQKIAAL